MSLIYVRKSRKLRTVPCGTPDKKYFRLALASSRLTCCSLLLRTALPDPPYDFSSDSIVVEFIELSQNQVGPRQLGCRLRGVYSYVVDSLDQLAFARSAFSETMLTISEYVPSVVVRHDVFQSFTHYRCKRYWSLIWRLVSVPYFWR